MSTYSEPLTLIAMTQQRDDVGNWNDAEETPRVVLCDVESVGRSEFYAASTSDMNSEIVFKLNKYEYQNERFCEYDGERYRIIKTYKDNATFEEIELTCEKVKRDGQN